MQLMIEIKNKYEEKAVLTALEDLKKFEWLSGKSPLEYFPSTSSDIITDIFYIIIRDNKLMYKCFPDHSENYICFAEFFETCISKLEHSCQDCEKQKHEVEINRCVDALIKFIKEIHNDK